MKKEITNKHDATFKEVFSQKRIAKDFIENNIPKEALDIMDMDSLELQKDTFINKDLKENFSDIIYKVKIRGQDAYICFLLEHKSYKDKMAIFQLNKYILESWMAMVQKENKEDLPIILPMLIYHGLENWNLKTDLRDMIKGFHQLPDYYKERVPVFKYDLINIASYEGEDFVKLKKLTAMMLTAFKYAFEKDSEIVIRNFLIALEEAGKEESEQTLIYYGEIYLKYIELTNENINEEKIIEAIKKMDGKGAVTVGMLEKREEKGKQEGIQRGRQEGREEGIKKVAKNLLKEGMKMDFIVKSTGLSESEVEKLKEEIN